MDSLPEYRKSSLKESEHKELRYKEERRLCKMDETWKDAKFIPSCAALD
jgi:hypothetical protein